MRSSTLRARSTLVVRRLILLCIILDISRTFSKYCFFCASSSFSPFSRVNSHLSLQKFIKNDNEHSGQPPTTSDDRRRQAPLGYCEICLTGNRGGRGAGRDLSRGTYGGCRRLAWAASLFFRCSWQPYRSVPSWGLPCRRHVFERQFIALTNHCDHDAASSRWGREMGRRSGRRSRPPHHARLRRRRTFLPQAAAQPHCE